MKTQWNGDALLDPSACSTPFGICDENTAGLCLYRSVPSCAQRLSASVMKTHPRDLANSIIWSCSTPFGICDENTDDTELYDVTALRCSTPFGICDENTHARGAAVVAMYECSTPFCICD